MENQQELFIIEATELIEELEASLLELENSPDNMELIQRIFRCMHTIKGNGSMFGFEVISNFTHNIETVYDLIRNGELKVDKNIINLTLSACDQIKRMMEEDANNHEPDFHAKKLIDSFYALLPENKSKEKESATPANEELNQTASSSQSLIYIRFKPDVNLFKCGSNPLLLIDEVRALGECRVVGYSSSIPELDKMDPEGCYFYWDMLCLSEHDLNAFKDVFIFVEDNAELYYKVIIDDASQFNSSLLNSLKDSLYDLSKESLEQISNSLFTQANEMLETLLSTQNEESAVSERFANPQTDDHVKSPKNQTQLVSSIRVAADKLDDLVDLAGELVIAKERLNQFVSQTTDSDLLAISEDIERLTDGLRDTAMNMRMLPIGTLFGKFKRLVRDLAGEQGKEVNLITEGQETELDKNVLEKLNDPMVHLIRNAIDHGIEPASIRMMNGKPKESPLKLRAYQSGADVMIQISDDGKGLDVESIRAKGIERGLILKDADLSDHDIFNLIFEPGFSTAKKVTEVSGRGVGMDVVRKKIEELRGSIQVESEKGKGTTITLCLPLTLGIIEGLLVRIDEDRFVLPLSTVEECLEIKKKNGAGREQQVIHLRGEAVPYIRLREHFELIHNEPEIQQMLITQLNNMRIGFVVDEIIGEHQIVMKSMGKLLNNVEGLSGATILGDGTVALILDTNKLLEMAEVERYKINSETYI